MINYMWAVAALLLYLQKYRMKKEITKKRNIIEGIFFFFISLSLGKQALPLLVGSRIICSFS